MNAPRTRDLVVVVPGILGSALERNGKELWGLSGRTAFNAILHLRETLDLLTPPKDLGDEDPHDGIQAKGLLPHLHLIPRLWKVDGYGILLRYLRKLCRTGNLIEFSYDWRLSNRLSAAKLETFAQKALCEWRDRSRQPHAKLVLVCHSMGGLVARYFVEVLGGAGITRRLVSIGTPYRGSVKALTALVNGLAWGKGPTRVDLSTLVSRLPSVYQLLPTYQCVSTPSGPLALEQARLPRLDEGQVRHGLAFHAEIAEAVQRSAAGPLRYTIVPLVGITQPTPQTVEFDGDRLVPLRRYRGQDLGGDGTVPRFSALPPEWPSDIDCLPTAQRHATLQNTDVLLSKVHALLTALDLGAIKSVGIALALDLPDLATAGQPFTLHVTSKPLDDRLGLRAILTNTESGATNQHSLRNLGDGRYELTLAFHVAGAYRVEVASFPGAPPVDPVSDAFVVWP